MAETKTRAVAKPKAKAAPKTTPAAAAAPKQPIVRPHGFALIGPFDETVAPDPVQAAMDAAVAQHNAAAQARQAAALKRTLARANQRGEADPVQKAMDEAVAEHAASVAAANAAAAGQVDEARLAAFRESVLEEARQVAMDAITDAAAAAAGHDETVRKTIVKVTNDGKGAS
jgi:hypothetical protein